MNALGIACNIEGGQPIVRAVLLDSEGVATPVFKSQGLEGDDLPQQLWNLGSALETRLRDLTVERAVIRTMDFDSRQRLTEPVVKRLQVEGVLLATVRHQVPVTASLSGRDLGTVCNTSKEAVYAEARLLGLQAKFEHAAAAALAGRMLT